MKQNVGAVDRAARIAIGIGLLLATAVLDTPNRWYALIGVVPLLTGLFGNCPLYALFGINTCPLKAKR